MADAWLIERSYICKPLIFSSLLDRDCALCRRDASDKHIKWPQSHMQLPPCAPAVLSYDICFSSLSPTIGLFVRDLALRGSDDFLVFVQCSFSSWHYVGFFLGFFWDDVLFFFVGALLHTNHIFHLSACTSTRVYIVLHLQLCAFDAVCCVCGGSHCGCPIRVSLHQTKKNVSYVKQVFFIFLFDLFTFHKKGFSGKKISAQKTFPK